jgi:hypothetical protein
LDIQCIRAISCVTTCGGPAISSGCCPCKPPTFDDIVCRADSGASSCNCAASELQWGPNGGLVSQQDRSSVTPCRTYVHERDFYRQERPSLSCKQELLACGSDALGIGDITAALAHADVQAALTVAPVIYGRDLRPVDGTVFRVSVAGKTIDVGAACAGQTGCRNIPAGVASLVSVLRAVDEQELHKAPCSGVFTEP